MMKRNVGKCHKFQIALVCSIMDKNEILNILQEYCYHFQYFTMINCDSVAIKIETSGRKADGVIA